LSIYRRPDDGLLLATVGDSFIAATDTSPAAEAMFNTMVAQAEKAHAKTTRSLVARLDRIIEEAPPVPIPDTRKSLLAGYNRYVEDETGRWRPRSRLCVCEGGLAPQCDACVR